MVLQIMVEEALLQIKLEDKVELKIVEISGKVDSTLSPTNLPATGKALIVIFIGVILLIGIFVFIRYEVLNRYVK